MNNYLICLYDTKIVIWKASHCLEISKWLDTALFFLPREKVSSMFPLVVKSKRLASG